MAGPQQLADWLLRHRDRFTPPLPSDELTALTEQQVAHTRGLRDIGRRLLSAIVHGTPPDAWDVAQLNRASSLAHSWPALSWPPGQAPTVEVMFAADAVLRAQTELAQSLIGLLTHDPGLLVACPAPNCVKFFYRNHPRREWCSSSCGNRARVARHYHRHARQDAPETTMSILSNTVGGAPDPD